MGNTLSTWWAGGETGDTKEQLEDDTLAGIEGSNPVEAVAAGHQAWASRFEDRDFLGVAKLYTQDCKICPSGSRTAYGRQEAVLGWESLLRTGIDRVVFSNTSLEMSTDDIMSDTSKYYLYPKNSKEAVDHGTHVMIWMKFKGKWFIHLHIFSSNKKSMKGPNDFISEMCYMWEYTYYMRDFAALSKLYTDDCVVCPPAWPQVDGNTRVERFWARFPSMGVDHIERTVQCIEEMGPGYVLAEIRYTMFDYRNAVIDTGKCIGIYKRGKDKRWSIHNEIFNSAASHAVIVTENENEQEKIQNITNTGSESNV